MFSSSTVQLVVIRRPSASSSDVFIGRKQTIVCQAVPLAAVRSTAFRTNFKLQCQITMAIYIVKFKKNILLGLYCWILRFDFGLLTVPAKDCSVEHCF